MKNKIILAALFMIGCVYMSSAQIIGGDAFLKNDYLELGIGEDGAFGTSGNAPVGFHPRPDLGETTGRLGFVADSDEDGWDVGIPNYCGDFFVPGSPVENLTLSIGATNYTNNNLEGYFDIPGGLSNYVDNADETSVEWIGDAAGINVYQKIDLPKDNNYIIMTVTLTNTSESSINEIYFSRNVDPDNEATLSGGSYSTQNTILSNPDGTTEQAIVEAVGTLHGCTVALGAINPNAKAVFGGFSNRDAEDLYTNGSGIFSSTVGDTQYDDDAIAISFNVGTLESGESTVLTLGYLLDPDDLDDFLVELAVGPAIQCKDITVPLVGSNAVVTASDLDDGTLDDDTAPEDIVFSFSETDMTDNTLNFDCSDAGSSVEVTIWAWDEEGTISVPCTSTISIVDTDAPVISCPGDMTVSSTEGVCGAAVFFSTFASDNCGVNTSCSLTQSIANTAYAGWQGGGADFVACDDGVLESITIYFTGDLAGEDLELSIYDGANPNTSAVLHTQTVLGSSLVVGSNTVALTSPVEISDGEVNAFTFAGNNNGMEINDSDIAPNTIMYCTDGASWTTFLGWDVKYDINIGYSSGPSCSLDQPVANTAYSGWQGGGADFIGCGDGALSSITIYFDGSLAGEDLELSIYDGANPNTAAVIHTQTVLGSSLVAGANTIALSGTVFIATGDVGTFTFTGNNDGMEINDGDIAPNTIMYCKGGSSWSTFAGWDVKYNMIFGPSAPVSCSHYSGDVFPVGTTTVTCSATDASGLTSTCSFDITVEDNTPPTLVCNAIVINLPESGEYTLGNADYPAISAGSSDNCEIISFEISGGATTFDCDDVGSTYTLILTGTDDANNSTDCTFDVMITNTDLVCNDPPFAVCMNLELDANADCLAMATAEDFDGGSSDPDDDTITFSVSPAGPYPIGSTTVELTVSDGQLESVCSATVVVTDYEDPTVISVDAVIEIDLSGTAILTVSDVVVSTNDNCGVLDVSLSQTEFDCDEVGDNEVIITVADVNGNTVEVPVTVSVVDATNPMVVCPSDVFTELEGFDCQLRVVMPSATWTDVCGQEQSTIDYSTDGATFEIVGNEVIGNFETAGLFDVLVTVTDPYGNVGECTFIVKIEDNIPPVIDHCQFMGPIEMEVEFDCGAIVEWEDVIVAKDNCDLLGDEIVIVRSHDPGDFFEFGLTEVVYMATDNNGNTSTCSFDVVVGEIIEASYTITGFNGLTIAFGNTSIGSTNYLWDFGDGTTSTATNPVHTFPSEGVFEVCLTVIGDCVTDQICHDMKANFNNLVVNETTIEMASALDVKSSAPVALLKNAKFTVFPNPSNGMAYMNLDLPSDSYINVVITDRLGREVSNSENVLYVKGNQTMSLKTDDLVSGVYYIRISSKDTLINQMKQLVIIK